MNVCKNIIAPNTKAKKVEFLRAQNIYVTANAKANEVNDKIRQFLNNKISANQRWHTLHSVKQKLTIPAIFRKVYGSSQALKRKGSVVGYLPASQKHAVLFDDDNKIMEFDLIKDDHLWQRVPWPNNVLDSSELGEHQSIPCSYINYGPECPRCFAFLGIGHQAWTFCSICRLNEPGAMWSTRFTSMRRPVCYDEE